MNLNHVKRILAAVVMLAVLWTIPAQAEFTAIVTAGRTTVYTDPERSRAIGNLPGATLVSVESDAGDTVKISFRGYTGYAARADLTALDDIAVRVTVNTASRVYQRPDLSSRWLAVPKGMEVNLIAVSGPWAMVENAGIIAYTNRDHLTEIADEPEEEPVDEIIYETYAAEVVSETMEVRSGEGKYLGMLPKGTQVKVLARNSWLADIELNGNRGFAQLKDLKRVEEDKINFEHSGSSVEQIIYLFLTKEMELNTAVACGILANVQKECSFVVTNESHDGGYGICQWTGVRNTRLKNWCEENDYDYATLEGQLWYLKYELEKWHPKTLKYLKTISNSPEGAYEAGYYFCYHFEVPASRAKRSVERGNLAKDTYWLRYKG